MIQAFKMAMKSISGNKFRAFLTMLGIIIGVMALVILVSLVSGATGTVTDTIESLGSNLLTVTVSDDKGAPVTLDTLNTWMTDPQIGLAAPSATTTASGKYGSTTKTVTVYGATPAYAPINGQSVLLGRFLTQADVENHTSVCVIPEKTAEDMVGYTDCLGEEIALDGMKFTIVGIFKNDDESLTGILTKNSMMAYIPYTTLMRLSSTVSSTITGFSVSAPQGGTMAATESAMKRLLLERFENDEDAFSILSQNMLEDAMKNVTGILTVLLGIQWAEANGTMEDTVLEAMGRSHTAADILDAYAIVRQSGIPMVNMDLIAGLPKDSLEGFQRTLEQVLELAPENITVHTLALKKGSRLAMERQGLPSGAETAGMLEYAWRRLREAGYLPYYLYRQKYMSGSLENIGWCKPGCEGIYNICIMEELHTILALGGGGSTKLTDPETGKIVRITNPKYPHVYLERVEQVCQNKAELVPFHLALRQRAEETT